MQKVLRRKETFLFVILVVLISTICVSQVLFSKEYFPLIFSPEIVYFQSSASSNLGTHSLYQKREGRCKSFMTQNITDDSLMAFCNVCPCNKHKPEVEICPKMFDQLFDTKSFQGVRCTQRARSFISGEYLNRSLIALASFPGSGNTWARLLLEQLTGLYTGSVYYDSKANKILTGSKVCPIGNVLIVKTHSLGNGLRRLKCGEIQTLDYRKAVYIVRNPYNAILAEFNREQGGKVATVTRETFSTQAWTKMVSSLSTRYYRHVVAWLETFQFPVYVLIYEELEKNLLWELYKVSKFIDVPVTFETMWCIKQRSEEQKVYKREKPEWLKPELLYSAEMKDVLNNYIDDIIQGAAKKHGVEQFFAGYNLETGSETH